MVSILREDEEWSWWRRGIEEVLEEILELFRNNFSFRNNRLIPK
jgi:hypothetical protein